MKAEGGNKTTKTTATLLKHVATKASEINKDDMALKAHP